MTFDLNFDLEHVQSVEFGVGRDDTSGQTFTAIPVDPSVQSTLQKMVSETLVEMNRDADIPAKYEPSDKHGSLEYLYLPLSDELATTIRILYDAKNLPIDAAALNKVDDLFCYFVRLTDTKQRKLTAVRRAGQFKGIVKNKGRLVRLLDDTLKIIEDTVFKLDNDFDLLADSKYLHILRPSGFEFTGNLQQAILGAVPANVALIKKELVFVEFDGIEQYAKQHARAARYIASICGQKDMKNIDKSALKKLCKDTGVKISETKSKVNIAKGEELAFLQVLDRRRYQLELIKNKPEKFVAASRKAIS